MATVAKTPRTTTSTVASAIAGPYSIGFRLFDDDGLKVYVNGVERADFTISSAYDEGYDDSASITFSTALSVHDVLTIDAALNPWREEDLVNTDPNLVQKLNVELGRLWSAMSDIKRDTLRSLRGFDAIAPVDGVDLSAISGAEAFATAAAASADEAEIAAALAVDAQQNLYDNYVGAWANTTNYTRGQWVQHDGSSYLCIATHTSLGTLNAPGTGSGWGGYWALFAAKGNAGAGTGDVLAANAGSEYTSVAGAFRNAVSAMLRAITPRASLNFATDTTLDSSIYNIGASNTQIPSGGASGDSVVISKIDASNYNFLWFGAAGAWVGQRIANVNDWTALATQAYVDAVRGVAQFSSRKTSGTNGLAFPTGSAAALEITTTDNSALGITLSMNQLTFTIAGSYLIEAFVPIRNASGSGRRAQCSIYNVTQATEIAPGQSCNIPNNIERLLMVSGVATIAANNVVELRGIANGGSALNGTAAMLGTEVYNIVRVRKV